eukprot:4027399-Alexandrium_andersonii.AAC.2
MISKCHRQKGGVPTTSEENLGRDDSDGPCAWGPEPTSKHNHLKGARASASTCVIFSGDHLH